MSLPFHLVKPIPGGRPLSSFYRSLEADPQWVCQAKLDGQRALWDGSRLWSRRGNLLDLCAPVLEELQQHAPGVMLDGEYLTEVGTFRRRARFVAFDVPGPGSLIERWSLLSELVAPMDPDLVEVCPHGVTWGDVEAQGWEGVVFKRTNSPYSRAMRPNKTTPAWIKFRAINS